MSNPAPITLEQLFRFKKPWGEDPGQDAAISLLDQELKAKPYAEVMRRDQPWYVDCWLRSSQSSGVPGWADIAAMAKDAGSRYPELVAAQWALESDFGKATSGRNNYFGLKGKGTAKTTTEFVNGKQVSVVAQFIDFPAPRDCVKYLVERWYCDWQGHTGVNGAPDRNAAARMLVSEGYATDPAYAEKLIGLMDQHAPVAKPATGSLLLTRTTTTTPAGLVRLRLQYLKNGKPVDAIYCVSGAPGRQEFRKGPDSRSGSLEPLPEGRWRIEDIAWASGRADDWSGSWGAGLGPVSTPLTYQGPGRTERAAIEIHIDWNQRSAPGTAGCIGIASQADYAKFVGWLRESDTRRLVVDWGLGSV